MRENLTVLILGSGAREHAISCAYEKSRHVRKIIVAPKEEDDFIAYRRKKEVIAHGNCSLKDTESLRAIARKYMPDIVDVSQDAAIASGITDILAKDGFAVFGPAREAARIEWDKCWSRNFMKRHDIPSPNFRCFDSQQNGKDYARSLYKEDPYKLLFVKASGLCMGYGALKAQNLAEAWRNIERMKDFGKAGENFLVEDGLDGEEFSYYAISDGKSHRILKSAQDNKRALNFDKGDQTGGLGANSPAMVTEPFEKSIERHFISAAINGLLKEDHPYKGILYLGGMVSAGKLYCIEYNARWGDPECQAVLPSVWTDYVDIVEAAINGKLGSIDIVQDNKSRVCIVGASRGYPNDYSNVIGKRIFDLDKAMKIDGITVYGAAVIAKGGKFYANGGRLFSIVAEGGNIQEARQKAYAAIAHITVEGNNLHYRTDIGWRDVERFLKL